VLVIRTAMGDTAGRLDGDDFSRVLREQHFPQQVQRMFKKEVLISKSSNPH
jgi:hypothetical protein